MIRVAPFHTKGNIDGDLTTCLNIAANRGITRGWRFAPVPFQLDLHLKLAFLLICLIVVMIGGSLATRLRMQSAALGFGLSVAISFLYYGFMRAGQALGHSGALPPYVAAWMGDVVFGVVGAVMMLQAQRR